MANIFISYIHEKEKVASALRTFVREKLKNQIDFRDVFVALDHWTVYAGEDWFNRIKQDLTSARVVLLLLSRESVVRPWVNFEAGAAWLAEKTIIPICFGELRKDAMPKPYSALQGLSLDDSDGPYYLVTSILHHLQPNSLAPPPFPPGDADVAKLLSAVKSLTALS